jgi:hypothetical protein
MSGGPVPPPPPVPELEPLLPVEVPPVAPPPVNPAVEFLERERIKARAGMMGEPALDVTAKIIACDMAGPGDRTVTKLYIRYDDLIAVLADAFGGSEAGT